jgi:hypothetical protein
VVVMTALPSFADGQIVTAANLNAVRQNIDNLSLISTGRLAQEGKSARPGVRLRLLNKQLVQKSTTSTIAWELSQRDTDFMWTSTRPNQLTVRTAGWYRVCAQVVWDFAATATAGQVERVAQIMVNGTGDTFDPATTNVTASSNTLMGNTSGSALPTRPVRQQVCDLFALPENTTIYIGVWHDGLNTYTFDNGSGGSVSKTGLFLLPNAAWGGCWVSARWVAMP